MATNNSVDLEDQEVLSGCEEVIKAILDEVLKIEEMTAAGLFCTSKTMFATTYTTDPENDGSITNPSENIDLTETASKNPDSLPSLMDVSSEEMQEVIRPNQMTNPTRHQEHNIKVETVLTEPENSDERHKHNEFSAMTSGLPGVSTNPAGCSSDHLYSVASSNTKKINPVGEVGAFKDDDARLIEIAKASLEQANHVQKSQINSKKPRLVANVVRSPLWIEPFLKGWGRELVHRSIYGEGTPTSDVYYFTPTKFKLRSYREVAEYLKESNETELSLDCFTFKKISIYHPPSEIVREAKKQSGIRKVKINMRDGNYEIKTPKKNDTALHVATKKTAMKEKVQIVPCTLNCPGHIGILPSLFCKTCLCLFHPACVCYTGDNKTFICNKCTESRQTAKLKRIMKENKLDARKKLKTMSEQSPGHITVDLTVENMGRVNIPGKPHSTNEGKTFPVAHVTNVGTTLPRLHVGPNRNFNTNYNLTNVNRPPPPLHAAPHYIRNPAKSIKIVRMWTPPSGLTPKTVPLPRQPPPLKMARFQPTLGLQLAPNGAGIITRPPPPLVVAPTQKSITLESAVGSVGGTSAQPVPANEGVRNPGQIVVMALPNNGAVAPPIPAPTLAPQIPQVHWSGSSANSNSAVVNLGQNSGIATGVQPAVTLPMQPLVLPQNIAPMPVQSNLLLHANLNNGEKTVQQQISPNRTVNSVTHPSTSTTGSNIYQKPKQMQSIQPKMATVNVNTTHVPTVLKLPAMIGTMKFILKTNAGLTTEIIVPNVKRIDESVPLHPKFVVVNKEGQPTALMLSYGQNILELPILNHQTLTPSIVTQPAVPIGNASLLDGGTAGNMLPIPPNHASTSKGTAVLPDKKNDSVTGSRGSSVFVEKLNDSNSKNLNAANSSLTDENKKSSSLSPGHCVMQNLFAGARTLLKVFEYLRHDDLSRASCVSRSWNWFASQQDLWKCIKLDGICVYEWDLLANIIKKYKTERLDMRGMQTFEDRNRTWHGFAASLQHLGMLRHIDFGQVPVSILHTVANNLSDLEGLTAEWITEFSGNNCRLDVGIFGQLKKLNKLRLRGVAGLHLPTYTISRGFSSLESSAALTHLSITSLREVPGPEFEFVKSLTNLVVLELGDCKNWTNETYGYLNGITDLKQLRLEMGNLIDKEILENWTTNLQKISHLELYNFDFEENLMSSLQQWPQLEYLSLWPNYSEGVEEVNTLILKGVQKLKSLKKLVWGVMTKQKPDSDKPVVQDAEPSKIFGDEDVIVLDEDNNKTSTDEKNSEGFTVAHSPLPKSKDFIPFSLPENGTDIDFKYPLENCDSFDKLERFLRESVFTNISFRLGSVTKDADDTLSRIASSVL